MGDRCEWHATVHPNHIKKFAKAMGIDPKSFTRTPADWAEFQEDQMDCSSPADLATAAQEGLRFYGFHRGGDAYPAEFFVSTGDGSIYIWSAEDRGEDDLFPYVKLDAHGWFDLRYLADIQDAIRDYNKLEAESGRK